MIRSRFLDRDEWEAKLRRWGCEPAPQFGFLDTAEFWLGPNGMPFTVPCEDDGSCDFWAVREICVLHGADPALPFPTIQ